MNILRKSAGVLCLLAAATACAYAGAADTKARKHHDGGSSSQPTPSQPSCSSGTGVPMGGSTGSAASATVSDDNSTNVSTQSAGGTSCAGWEPFMTANLGPVIPQNAIAVTNIQTLSNWIDAEDTGSGSDGGATGAMNLVSSPSYNGQALEFTTSFTDSGDERYSTVFGDDPTPSNFVWDGWIYLTSSASDIANLEMDMNQVIANGDTVIFGFQCDGYSGTWDYTTNAGTPESPIDEWVHSSAACNVQDWSIETWHHVQVLYSRDELGNVTYESVWLDGVPSVINATVPSAFSLGWGQVLLTNFEVDGLGASGSSTVYLDDLTVYRW